LLAKVSVSEGKFTLAKEIHKDAVDDRPKHWAPYYALGEYYYNQGFEEDALRVLSEASALAPRNAWPYNLTGAIHFHADRFDQASVMWERALDLAPARWVYSNLGTSYFVESRYADAVRMYEMALEEDDAYYGTWGNLAAACDVAPGEEGRATECYIRAIELAEEQLKPTTRDAGLLASLASYNAELGDSARAWDYLGRAIELRPYNAAVMFDIGLTHEVLGDRDAALDWVGRARGSGFSRKIVESTPGLRDLCTDERYRRLVGRGGGR
jgi:tetratricopeptide (TPR) repeat protein